MKSSSFSPTALSGVAASAFTAELVPKVKKAAPWPLGKVGLLALALSFFAVFILLPLVIVFAEALHRGWQTYVNAIVKPDALAALGLSTMVVAVVVVLNTVFGVAAALALGKHEFPGKTLLTALIDLPFAVSPVIAGLMFVLLFGRLGWWGNWLRQHGVQIIFAPPGIVIATLFVTCPYVARQLLPIIKAQGQTNDEAALLLGANAWQTFWLVTLPSIRWPLAHGVLLCTARALGEFGAVSVVSGHINGRTNTMPLQVEILYNEYHSTAAFALASLLTLMSLATLVLKHLTIKRTQS